MGVTGVGRLQAGRKKEFKKCRRGPRRFFLSELGTLGAWMTSSGLLKKSDENCTCSCRAEAGAEELHEDVICAFAMSSSDKDKFAAELEGALHIKEQEAIIAEVAYTQNTRILLSYIYIFDDATVHLILHPPPARCPFLFLAVRRSM